MQKIFAKKYIDEVVLESYDKKRTEHLDDLEGSETKTWPIGYTIENSAGSYPTINKATGKPERIRESSYVVTLYGLSNAESERIAQGLKSKFKQEMVILDKGQGGLRR